MKHFELKKIRSGALIAVMIWALPLQAAEPMEVKWSKVCEVAGQHELQVTAAGGDSITGYCVSITVNEIAIRTKDNKVVKVARKTLSRIEMQRAKGHQLRSLRNDMHAGLRVSTDALLSPWALGGIVAVPAVLAWGAASAPFCLLGDLRAKVAGTREIRPI